MQAILEDINGKVSRKVNLSAYTSPNKAVYLAENTSDIRIRPYNAFEISVQATLVDGRIIKVRDYEEGLTVALDELYGVARAYLG